MVALSGDVEPVISGIQKRFRDLSVDVRGERLIRYIVNQLLLGRSVDDIMEDPYLLSHSTEETREKILQNPVVINAIEQEISQQFATYRSATGRPHGDPGPEQ